ncbi:DUF3556 domain-containing protein [Streptomyces cavernicola]|uniref:DUF3556 domain-containing protein n=1 Tax=Streptomyces cavernicola TaxID=3043613 RepID=A0ABT6SGH1_9ACTN|nr:DUF3556 domain-containing protein [Streptomyces sp. B-S-A6]MDI3406954.1 DUF3556 domain-containing protein [Streptomyces sp. B-S-A6]
MGFMKPTLPAVDADAFRALPRPDRLRILTRDWVENGFGSPYAVYLFYLVKCLLYVGGAALVISLTPGLSSVSEIGSWWSEPIVYQKLIVFTLLWEVIGLGCGSGPLTSRFNPPIGSVLYWLRPGTIRLPPWPGRVPLTRGDRRGIVDVLLYAGVLASGVWLLGRPGDGTSIAGFGQVGLIDPLAAVPLIASVAVLGLRDKTIFLAARGEQYWLSLLVFFFPYNDQFIGFQLVMLAIWWGAATSKLNHHFPFVVATMLSNAPLVPGGRVKRALYRNHPDDLRPSKLPFLLAHIGTATEYLVPLYLVFLGDGGRLTWAALIYMAVFHLHILSAIPMGVPLEWNIFFVFSLFYLFGAHGDLTVWDLQSPWLLAVLLPSLVLLPVLGNIRPDLVSFLPAMRYYAGNWATSVWVFTGDAMNRMEAGLTTATRLAAHQLETLYDADTAMLTISKADGFRSMHSHGRALNGLVDRVTDSQDDFVTVEGEVVAGFAVGWNFGEGHLHNDQLLRAVQDRCGFAPGEVRVICLEGQPIHRQTQVYEIHDASLGLLESGHVKVRDMLDRQPWPTDGPNYPVHGVRSLHPLRPVPSAASPTDASPTDLGTAS